MMGDSLGIFTETHGLMSELSPETCPDIVLRVQGLSVHNVMPQCERGGLQSGAFLTPSSPGCACVRYVCSRAHMHQHACIDQPCPSIICSRGIVLSPPSPPRSACGWTPSKGNSGSWVLFSSCSVQNFERIFVQTLPTGVWGFWETPGRISRSIEGISHFLVKKWGDWTLDSVWSRVQGSVSRKQWQKKAGSGFVLLFQGNLLCSVPPPGAAECDKGGDLMGGCGKERVS